MKYILLPFQLVGLVVLTFLVGVPATLIGSLLPGISRKGHLFRCVTMGYGTLVLGMFGVRVKTVGAERVDRSKAFVFMSNHVSNLDPPVAAVTARHPLHWVFKKELGAIPVFGWTLRSGGQIMVDRRNIRQARAMMAKVVSEMKGNNSVMIFPEGTRSFDGKLAPFKKGGFYIAVQTGWPIVPMRIDGTYDLNPPKSWFVKRGTVTVRYGDPIPTAGLSEADMEPLMEKVRAAMIAL